METSCINALLGLGFESAQASEEGACPVIPKIAFTVQPGHSSTFQKLYDLS